MNPPPNPRAATAAAEMRAYNAPLLANPPCDVYRLTWPAQKPAVCCIAGQWRRVVSTGEIEAWYTAEQLREALTAMQAAHAASQPQAEEQAE